MTLTSKQVSKIEALIKREHKHNKRMFSHAFKVEDDKAYYTNANIAIRVKNNIMDKAVAIEDDSNTNFPDIDRVFHEGLKKLGTIDVKDLLKELKNYKKENPKPLRKNFEHKYQYINAMSNWEIFHIADNSEVKHGADKTKICFAYDRLLNSLEFLNVFGVDSVDLECDNHSLYSPFQLKSELVDVAICPFRVN